MLELFRRESKKFIYLPIASDHVLDVTLDQIPMAATENYFRLWLKEMYLKDDREWFVNRYPVVHSLVKFQFGDNPEVIIPHVAGSTNIAELKSESLGNVIQMSHRLTTLIPFNGGSVEIAIGLVAMKGENYLKNVIKILGSFAAMLTQPQLSLAINVADKLTTGIQDLFDAIEGNLHLGLSQTFTAQPSSGMNQLKAQYIAVIKAERKDISEDKLWIKGDQLYYGDRNSNAPFMNYEHMLVLLEKCNERDDWNSIKNINENLKKAREILGVDKNLAEKFKAAATVAARTSDDLTLIDKFRVIKAIDDEFEKWAAIESQRRPIVATTAATVKMYALWDEIPTYDNTPAISYSTSLDDVMANAMSFEEARAKLMH
jgi:hypothetical protein